ncbi:hypothetical protein HD596_008614 [Nonomuraea jabiensis]|uniref:Uncharacterized protein n=1 Tax=Nonomuraea jabiensis TaxID=882448 RepID=A0A7W9LFK2_9ACTN|nr:hypothetical protein [Nonomuraea jabiensis]
MTWCVPARSACSAGVEQPPWSMRTILLGVPRSRRRRSWSAGVASSAARYVVGADSVGGCPALAEPFNSETDGARLSEIFDWYVSGDLGRPKTPCTGGEDLPRQKRRDLPALLQGPPLPNVTPAARTRLRTTEERRCGSLLPLVHRAQSLLRQQHLLTVAGPLVRTEGVAEGFHPPEVVLVFEDPAPTSKIPALERPAFAKVASAAHPGDTLTVSGLLPERLALYHRLTSKSVISGEAFGSRRSRRGSRRG